MRFARAMLAAFAVAAFTTPAFAQDVAEVIPTDATNAVIMDHETGLVLFAKDAETPMPPASMSKLMTMLMVFEALRDGAISLNDEFIVSEDAWRRGGWASGSSNMCLEPDTRVRVEDLIRGVIILSGNDASIVLAENLAGSEAAFADQMTKRAQELGLDSATFANATGWPDPGHRISALDLAKVARILIDEFPEYYEIYSEREFDYCVDSPANRFNRNPLLATFDGADGLKTGYTSESGYGLVASAVRNGVRRIVVFNGTQSQQGRAREAERLLRSAFADFRVATPFDVGDVVGSVEVFQGVEATVPLRVTDPLTVGYHRRSARDAQATLVFDGPLRAPVAEGAPVGVLRLEAPGIAAVETPVVTAASVERQGMRDRMLGALAAMIRGEV